jgi:hypothetical protein
VGKCQKGASTTWFYNNYNKLLFGFCTTPLVIGISSTLIFCESIFAIAGAAVGFVGIQFVEVIEKYIDLKELKRERDCTVNKKH